MYRPARLARPGAAPTRLSHSALSSTIVRSSIQCPPSVPRTSAPTSVPQRPFATFAESTTGIGKPPPPPLQQPKESLGLAEIGPLSEYRRMVATGELKPDQEQLRAVVQLQKLCEDLLDYKPPDIKALPGKPLWKRGFKLFGRSGGDYNLSENAFAGSSLIPILVDGEEPDYIGPRGLWIHGEVGTGKTLLLDLFHRTMPTPHKHRAHFHHFISSLHAKLRDWSLLPVDSPARAASGHVTAAIARELVAEGWLLCFDEFQVTDVATAVLVRQVLASMFRMGAVMVVTSNRAPEELYQGGFQKSIYAPFIDLIKERCNVLTVRSETDYRVVMAKEAPLAKGQEMYFNISDPQTTERFMKRVLELFRNQNPKKKTFKIYGRTVTVPKATEDGKAIFTFDQLCGSHDDPMGPVDYLELCSRYHTILVQSVPVMGLAQKNEARRFITFLDAAYENKVKVIMSADASPDSLFVTSPQTPLGAAPPDDSPDAVMHREMLGDLLGGFELVRGVTGDDGTTSTDVRKLAIFTGSDERFAFRRAVSRIKEMGTQGYLALPHAPVRLDWRGLERVRGVAGAVEDVAVSEEAKKDAPEPAPPKRVAIEGVVMDAVAVVGDEVPRGARITEMGAEAYGDDFGEEAGYRGYVVRMQHRLASGGENRSGAPPPTPKTGGILKMLDTRQEGLPKVQETHFWGMIPARWTGGRTAAFWSNMSTGDAEAGKKEEKEKQEALDETKKK
ncbi:hypothetical protein HDU96_001735 [Phlyctochytrium bullatum]|nr:hypothetical protein HDU96_001735 [Phlyctochytrium bullatum]